MDEGKSRVEAGGQGKRVKTNVGVNSGERTQNISESAPRSDKPEGHPLLHLLEKNNQIPGF